MKRVIIVHCWGGYPEYCWYPSVEKQLEQKGFLVEVPAIPDTDAPNIKNWLPKLQEVVGKADKDTYLIGHSAGAITILRYLESLSGEEEIGGAVLVAGFLDDLGIPEIKNFFAEPINLEKIRSTCSKFVAIASDDDPYVPLDRADVLKEKLGAEIIVKHAMKHFSGPVDNEMSCVELPDVVEAVLKISEQ